MVASLKNGFVQIQGYKICRYEWWNKQKIALEYTIEGDKCETLSDERLNNHDCAYIVFSRGNFRIVHQAIDDLELVESQVWQGL